MRESLDNLLHRCSVIRAVSEDNVDVWLLESLERALESFTDVLLGETTGVGLLASSPKEDLGGKDVLIPGPAKLLEGLSHLLLTLTVGIDLSSVECVALEVY